MCSIFYGIRYYIIQVEIIQSKFIKNTVGSSYETLGVDNCDNNIQIHVPNLTQFTAYHRLYRF